MTTFDTFLAAVLDRATAAAGTDGSSTVEAHHVLLAVAASEEPSTRALLASVGLDQAAIRTALEREFAQSLGTAGVSVDPAGLPRPSPEPRAGARRGRSSHPRAESPPLGSSVKLALERGLGSTTRKRDLRPAHLLLGIVQASVGTLPRALDLSGVDRAALIERVTQSLTEAGR